MGAYLDELFERTAHYFAKQSKLENCLTNNQQNVVISETQIHPSIGREKSTFETITGLIKNINPKQVVALGVPLAFVISSASAYAIAKNYNQDKVSKTYNLPNGINGLRQDDNSSQDNNSSIVSNFPYVEYNFRLTNNDEIYNVLEDVGDIYFAHQMFHLDPYMTRSGKIVYPLYFINSACEHCINLFDPISNSSCNLTNFNLSNGRISNIVEHENKVYVIVREGDDSNYTNILKIIDIDSKLERKINLSNDAKTILITLTPENQLSLCYNWFNNLTKRVELRDLDGNLISSYNITFGEDEHYMSKYCLSANKIGNFLFITPTHLINLTNGERTSIKDFSYDLYVPSPNYLDKIVIINRSSKILTVFDPINNASTDYNLTALGIEETFSGEDYSLYNARLIDDYVYFNVCKITDYTGLCKHDEKVYRFNVNNGNLELLVTFKDYPLNVKTVSFFEKDNKILIERNNAFCSPGNFSYSFYLLDEGWKEGEIEVNITGENLDVNNTLIDILNDTYFIDGKRHLSPDEKTLSFKPKYNFWIKNIEVDLKDKAGNIRTIKFNNSEDGYYNLTENMSNFPISKEELKNKSLHQLISEKIKDDFYVSELRITQKIPAFSNVYKFNDSVALKSKYDKEKLEKKIKESKVAILACPVRLEVLTSQGRVGYNVSSNQSNCEVEGAFYSGRDEPELVLVPEGVELKEIKVSPLNNISNSSNETYRLTFETNGQSQTLERKVEPERIETFILNESVNPGNNSAPIIEFKEFTPLNNPPVNDTIPGNNTNNTGNNSNPEENSTIPEDNSTIPEDNNPNDNTTLPENDTVIITSSQDKKRNYLIGGGIVTGIASALAAAGAYLRRAIFNSKTEESKIEELKPKKAVKKKKVIKKRKILKN